MTSTLKLWQVNDRPDVPDEYHRHCVLYWSETEEEAIAEWKRLHPDRGEAADSEAYSAAECRTTATPQKDQPHHEHRMRIAREVGWSCPYDASCDDCGLYAMDGQFTVCEECNCCEECGCRCDQEEE